MSTNFVYANNVNTTLSAPITTTGQTTIVLTSSANLPTLTAGQVFVLTLNDAATQAVFEIVYVTAIAGASLTVVRGQEGTAATTWLSGDFAYGALTAGELANFSSGGAFVDLTTNQTIGGIKTFVDAPVLPDGFVDLVNGQTIAGVKIFASAPVMSGASITDDSIPLESLAVDVVASLNGLVGAVVIESPDSSITVDATSSPDIKLTATPVSWIGALVVAEGSTPTGTTQAVTIPIVLPTGTWKIYGAVYGFLGAGGSGNIVLTFTSTVSNNTISTANMGLSYIQLSDTANGGQQPVLTLTWTGSPLSGTTYLRIEAIRTGF